MPWCWAQLIVPKLQHSPGPVHSLPSAVHEPPLLDPPELLPPPLLDPPELLPPELLPPPLLDPPELLLPPCAHAAAALQSAAPLRHVSCEELRLEHFDVHCDFGTPEHTLAAWVHAVSHEGAPPDDPPLDELLVLLPELELLHAA